MSTPTTVPELVEAVQRKLQVTVDLEPMVETWTAIYHALGCQNEKVLGALAVVGEDSIRKRVIAAARKYIGLKEIGQNAGPQVEEILSACAMPGSRAPYCGCFNRRAYDLGGAKDKGPQGSESAWSPNWVSDPTWTRAKGGKLPQPGDAFGIYFSSKRRIAHTGLVVEWGDVHVLTIEGNTGAAGSVGEADRNGDGVYLKRRRTSEIHSVRSWLG